MIYLKTQQEKQYDKQRLQKPSASQKKYMHYKQEITIIAYKDIVKTKEGQTKEHPKDKTPSNNTNKKEHTERQKQKQKQNKTIIKTNKNNENKRKHEKRKNI